MMSVKVTDAWDAARLNAKEAIRAEIREAKRVITRARGNMLDGMPNSLRYIDEERLKRAKAMWLYGPSVIEDLDRAPVHPSIFRHYGDSERDRLIRIAMDVSMTVHGRTVYRADDPSWSGEVWAMNTVAKILNECIGQAWDEEAVARWEASLEEGRARMPVSDPVDFNEEEAA